jgi:hypothetical protein
MVHVWIWCVGGRKGVSGELRAVEIRFSLFYRLTYHLDAEKCLSISLADK